MDAQFDKRHSKIIYIVSCNTYEVEPREYIENAPSKNENRKTHTHIKNEENTHMTS